MTWEWVNNDSLIALTMRMCGSCVFAAVSSRWQYSTSSHSLCRVFKGSLSWTGMATFDRSLPMLLRRILHRFTVSFMRELGKRSRRVTAQSLPLPEDTKHTQTINNGCKESWSFIKMNLDSASLKISFVMPFSFLQYSTDVLSLTSLMYESSSDTWSQKINFIQNIFH